MPDIQLKISRTKLETIASFRALFLQESSFQFVHNKCHEYGWADHYLFVLDGIKAGYGAVWGTDRREDRDTIFEFFLTRPFRKHASLIFREFSSVSDAIFAECQSNDPLLSSMVFEYAKDIHAEAILFEDHCQTSLHIPGAIFRKASAEDHIDINSGDHILEYNGEIVGQGGFLLNYNFPYADIYMHVEEPYRKKGFGSFIVQELKKVIYSMGRVPAARCNINNKISKTTLLRAGFAVCGAILKGDIKGPEK